MKKPGLVMHTIERLILAHPRRQVRTSLGKKLRATMQALDECIKTRSKLPQYDVPDLLRLFDASQFCLMFDADITVLIRDTTCRSNWWESRLYGRLLATTMVECVEDIPAVLGKEFRASLKSVAIPDPPRQRLSVVTKNFSAFRKSHEAVLRRICTIAGAHRDHDAGLQAAVIENLDMRGLTKMATEVTDLLSAFVQAMNELLREVSVSNEIIKSFSKKSV